MSQKPEPGKPVFSSRYYLNFLKEQTLLSDSSQCRKHRSVLLCILTTKICVLPYSKTTHILYFQYTSSISVELSFHSLLVAGQC